MPVEPESVVTAYCAPGMAEYAARLLEMRGERYREVVEHPYMAGRLDVVLATDPGWWKVGRLPGARP